MKNQNKAFMVGRFFFIDLRIFISVIQYGEEEVYLRKSSNWFI